MGKYIRTKVRIIADVYDLPGFEMLCDRYNPLISEFSATTFLVPALLRRRALPLDPFAKEACCCC